MILAGVALSAILANDGIIAKATEGAKQNNLQAAKEELELAVSAILCDYLYIGSNSNVRDYIIANKEELQKNLGNNTFNINEDSGIIDYKGHQFKVKDNGQIEIVEGINLNKEKIILQIIDNQATEEIIIATTTGGNGEIVWESLDNSIVTVDSKGKITAVKEGKTKIIARYDIFTAECEVVVENAKALTSLTLDKTEIFMEKGKQESISIIRNEDESERVKWEILDNSMAQIQEDENNNIIITAIKKGSTMIVAKNQSGTISSSCSLNIYEVVREAEKIEMFEDIRSSGLTVEQYGLSASFNNVNDMQYLNSTEFAVGRWSGAGDFSAVMTYTLKEKIIAEKLFCNYSFSPDGGASISGTIKIYYVDGEVQSVSTGNAPGTAVDQYIDKPLDIILKEKMISKIEFFISEEM